jgi:hypothetical protein
MAGGAANIPLRHPPRPRFQLTVIPDRISNLTLPITRRPTPLINLTSLVSAVGCIGLFGGDATPRPRGARHPHDPRLPPTLGNHIAPRALDATAFLPRGNRPANLSPQ